MKREDFQLKAVKLKSSGAGLSVKYIQRDASSGVSMSDVITKESDRVPHPDLVKAVKSLDMYLATSLHLMALSSLVQYVDETNVNKQKAFKSLSPVIEEQQRAILDRLDVRSVALSGSETNEAVIISGVLSYKTYAGNVNSPRMRLSGDVLGNEMAMAESIQELSDEVYEYLFNKKQAQLEAAFD